MTAFGRGELAAITKTLRTAIGRAMRAAHRVLERPYSDGDVPTSGAKVTSGSPQDDPTELIDAATSEAIESALEAAFKDSDHPLSRGFLLIDEEQGGVTRFLSKRGEPELVILVDSCDDTTKAKRGLGGSCLISAYHRKNGWCSAVVGDITRRTLYYRERERRSHALLLLDGGGQGDPSGHIKELRSSEKTDLHRLSLNMYLGKPERVLRAPDEAGDLLSKLKGAALLSEGGSRGILLVAEGLVDVALEPSKGFRPLDFIPGAFIADGVEKIACLDRAGKALSFDPCEEMERVIQSSRSSAELNATLDDIRQTFVVAATRELGLKIVEALGEPRPKASRSIRSPRRAQLVVDLTQHSVLYRNRTIRLSRRHFYLLAALVENPAQIVGETTVNASTRSFGYGLNVGTGKLPRLKSELMMRLRKVVKRAPKDLVETVESELRLNLNREDVQLITPSNGTVRGTAEEA